MVFFFFSSYLNSLNTVAPSPKPDISTEGILWHLVKLFGNAHDSGLRQRCTKLIQSLAIWKPDLRDLLKARQKALDQAVQGMHSFFNRYQYTINAGLSIAHSLFFCFTGLGVHGLIADPTNNLISLHIALKNELQRHIDTYKTAIHKLEELSPVTLSSDPAQSSHQRLLAISYNDIQQRLIDNKTLLTILDKPALKQLTYLIENLSQRVQNDKEVLLCVGEMKRIDPQLTTDTRYAFFYNCLFNFLMHV